MGKSICTITHKDSGHDSYLPTEAIEGSTNVFANSLGVFRKGDNLEEHGHPSVAKEGSKTVFVNSKEVIRKSDPIEGNPNKSECSGTMEEGYDKVKVGD